MYDYIAILEIAIVVLEEQHNLLHGTYHNLENWQELPKNIK